MELLVQQIPDRLNGRTYIESLHNQFINFEILRLNLAHKTINLIEVSWHYLFVVKKVENMISKILKCIGYIF